MSDQELTTTRQHGTPAARRIPVPVEEPLSGYDYADAFEVDLHPSDTRSSEEFARDAIERAPWLVRTTVRVAHRSVLRIRLAAPGTPGHLMGWKVVRSAPDALQLEATSPLLGRGVIVGRRPEPTRASITTYLFYDRPRTGRALWTVVGPLHRLIAPYLLERAAVMGA